MTVAIYGVLYASALLFAAGCIVRAVRYARAPLHLRWELYPVPHEAPERAAHGGSYFEQSEWWTKPMHRNRSGEIKCMACEMLFLKGLWEFNRPLWFRSFPFHAGLYLLIGTAALAGVGALLPAAGPLSYAIGMVYPITGALGLVLAIAGAAALLHRRTTDAVLKPYTTPADIFNLAFFIASFGLLAAGFRAPSGPDLLAVARGVLSFDTALHIPGLLAAGLVLTALLTAYIPMTHMSHFIAKYFTYHSVRWDDTVSREGSTLQRKFAEYLTYRPTWSAPHIGADGTKTWAEIATTNPAREVKK